MSRYPTETAGELISLSGFMTVCEQQGVTINPDCIDPVIEQRPTTGDEGHEPLPILRVMAEAGRLLRKDPGIELADRPIRNTRPFGDDVAANALAKIINTSIEPVLPSSGIAAFSSRDMKNINACPYGELAFAAVYRDLRNPFDLDITSGGQIITDANGKPLFIRKAAGEGSSLSLQEFAVNGVAYPAGSIARVETDEDMIDEETGQHYLIVCGGGFEAVSMEDISGIAFRRLSAFAVQPGQRSAFGRAMEFGYGRRVQQLIKWVSMKDFREAAQYALDYNSAMQAAHQYDLEDFVAFD